MTDYGLSMAALGIFLGLVSGGFLVAEAIHALTDAVRYFAHVVEDWS